jgi:hypothetical protein
MERIAGLVLLVFLAGCNADRQSGSRLDEGSKPQWLSETIEPTNLRLLLDSSSAKTQIVQPSGGRMEVGATDGSFFVLEIPSGALPAPTRITMTPVTKGEGLPGSSRMVASVHLGPDGLQLDKFAKLTIQPAAPVNEAEAYGFAYSGTGSDAHLHPVQGEPGNVELLLSHFSGHGILHIQPTDLALRVLRRVKGESERLKAAISRSLLENQCTQYRRSRDAGELANESKETTEGLEQRCRGVSGDADMKEILKLAVEYYQFAVRPLWLLALKDPAAYDCAARAGRSFQRQIALLAGVEDTLVTQGLDPSAVRKLLSGNVWGTLGDELTRQLNDQSNLEAEARKAHIKLAIERIRERCHKGDVAVVRDAFALGHVFGLQGEDVAELQAEAFDLLRRCGVFELEFVSQVTNGFPDGQFSYELRAMTQGAPRFMPESLNRDSGNWNVVTPLKYVRHAATGRVRGGTARFSSGGTRDSEIRIHSVQPIQGQALPALDCQGERILVSAPNPDTMQVRLQIAAPSEIVHYGPGTTFVQDWHNHFYNFRRDGDQLFEPTEEMSGGPPPPEGYPLILLLPRSGSGGEWRLDFKTDENPGSGLSLFEAGHITLRLKPQL